MLPPGRPHQAQTTSQNLGSVFFAMLGMISENCLEMIADLVFAGLAWGCCAHLSLGLLSSAIETIKHSETNKALVNNYSFEKDIYTQF